MRSVFRTQIEERNDVIRSLSNAVKGRKIGDRFRAGFPPAPLDPRESLERIVRAIGATVYQVGNELAVTRALPNATLVSVPPLCVVGGAVQSASTVAGALALLARKSGLEASQITLKPTNMKHGKQDL
jgi:hypothetical protein